LRELALSSAANREMEHALTAAACKTVKPALFTADAVEESMSIWDMSEWRVTCDV
jgi:hypothetical protein